MKYKTDKIDVLGKIDKQEYNDLILSLEREIPGRFPSIHREQVVDIINLVLYEIAHRIKFYIPYSERRDMLPDPDTLEQDSDILHDTIKILNNLVLDWSYVMNKIKEKQKDLISVGNIEL